MIIRISVIRPAVLVAILLGTLVPFYSHAADCAFNRNLEEGTVGEDVRCLQQYLNTTGYKVASVGAGAPGKETDEFKTLTKEAVIRWQVANKISPAAGYFGPRSQTVYRLLLAGNGTAVSQTPSQSGNALIDDLLAKIDILQSQKKVEETTKESAKTSATEDKEEGSSEAQSVRKLMMSVLSMIEDVEDDLEDSEDADATQSAEEYLANARQDLFDGLRKYLEANYSKAESRLDSAIKWGDKASAEVGSESEKSEARDLLEELGDRIDEVEELIDEAIDDGDETELAEEYLDEAKDVFDDAEEAYDDGDYDDAIDYLEEVEDLLDDAEDSIGEEDNSQDVEDLLDDARAELDDAWDDVEEALDDGDDVGDAEDLLDEAESILDEAEEVLDDGDGDEAEDLIDEALDLIDHALDEF